MQKRRRGWRKGDYAVYPKFPRTLFQITKFAGDLIFLKPCGGYRPTEDERIRFFSVGGNYVYRKVWAVIFANELERPNEMEVIALMSLDADGLIEPCPVCGREEAGFEECPESKLVRQHSEEWIEPVDCPCCETCRKKCAP